jgi:hypothetical protein
VNNPELIEAYERFRRTGPEWGADQLTNHGPMAVEVLVRRGRSEVVPEWVDGYIGRLDELPKATGEITSELSGAEDQPTLDELARALAFWAARARDLPASPGPAGWLDPLPALDAVPRIPSQRGNLAARFDQLTVDSGWTASVARLRPAATPGEVPARLADLVAAATLRYLAYGHGQPVLLVHTATAPNAVLHTLPALPDSLWRPSLTAVWAACAAIFAAYAPPEGAAPAQRPALPDGSAAVAEVIDRAVDHGDEHVIKFTDTAVDVYLATGNIDALAAALRAGMLIPGNRT